MHASIHPVYTWGQDKIFAGESANAVLLVEWKGTEGEELRKRNRRTVAREIELRIWLEPHVTFKAAHGCVAEAGEGRSLLLRLGKIQAGTRQYIALEFTFSPMNAGYHEAIWLQWQYRQPPVDRLRELPLIKLGLEYTLHTDILRTSCCFLVEKHLELLKTESIREEVALLQTNNPLHPVYEKLRRQADKLLLLAARSGDMVLVREAELLYKQLSSESRPWIKAYAGSTR